MFILSFVLPLATLTDWALVMLQPGCLSAWAGEEVQLVVVAINCWRRLFCLSSSRMRHCPCCNLIFFLSGNSGSANKVTNEHELAVQWSLLLCNGLARSTLIPTLLRGVARLLYIFVLVLLQQQDCTLCDFSKQARGQQK